MLLWFEFALFVGLMLVIALMFWRIRMTQDEVLAALAALDTKVKALIAKASTPPAPVDLAPVGAAVAAISAEVDAANPSA